MKSLIGIAFTLFATAAQAQYGGLPGAPGLNAPGATGLCCRYDDQQRQDNNTGYQPYPTAEPQITTHSYDAPKPPTFDPYGSRNNFGGNRYNGGMDDDDQ